MSMSGGGCEHGKCTVLYGVHLQMIAASQEDRSRMRMTTAKVAASVLMIVLMSVADDVHDAMRCR